MMSEFGVPITIAVAALVMAATVASAQTTLKVDGSTGAMPLVQPSEDEGLIFSLRW